MTDDDALDPVIRDRFDALDPVVAPDTRQAVGTTTAPSPGRAPWRTLAVAAALVLLVTGAILVLDHRGDDAEVAIGGSTGTVATTVGPVGTALPSGAGVPRETPPVAGLLGRADPAIARAGTSVAVTPSTAVQRPCLNIVTVRSIERRSTVGQIVDGTSWVPNPTGGVPTYPGCLGETSADPVVVTIPDLVPGRYVLCLTVDPTPDSCALAAIGSDDPTALDYAVADPMTAAPGGLVRITPTGTITRWCTDIVDVFVEQGGPQRGQLLGGADWVPLGEGAAPTLPVCEGSVTADPIDIVVPPIEPGRVRRLHRRGPRRLCVAVRQRRSASGHVRRCGRRSSVRHPGCRRRDHTGRAGPADVRRHRHSARGIVRLRHRPGARRRHVGREPRRGSGHDGARVRGRHQRRSGACRPAPIPGNRYEFCVTPDRVPAGCAIIGIYTFAGTAAIEPTSAAPGAAVTLTPVGAVARSCGDAVVVSAVADPTIVGQVLATGEWLSTGADAPGAPACPPRVTADSLTFVVPPVPPGDYGFCVGGDRAIEGCASLTVLPTVGAGVAATAEPVVAAPGEVVTITPAAVVPRICTNIVTVLATDPPERIGATGVNGFFSPITEDGLVVPSCAEPDSADPLAIVLPELEPGIYQFCLSSDLRPESCAVVEIVGV